jgi:His-Xaa-Ser system protein HxsD
MTYQISDHFLHLTIDGRLYNESILYKCFYWYTREFAVNIKLENETDYNISLQPVTKRESSYNWEEVIEKIKRDLIDFRLRDIIAKETQTIKELIIAKAFAYYDTQDPLISDVSDRVGFDPENV